MERFRTLFIALALFTMLAFPLLRIASEIAGHAFFSAGGYLSLMAAVFLLLFFWPEVKRLSGKTR